MHLAVRSVLTNLAVGGLIWSGCENDCVRRMEVEDRD